MVWAELTPCAPSTIITAVQIDINAPPHPNYRNIVFHPRSTKSIYDKYINKLSLSERKKTVSNFACVIWSGIILVSNAGRGDRCCVGRHCCTEGLMIASDAWGWQPFQPLHLCCVVMTESASLAAENLSFEADSICSPAQKGWLVRRCLFERRWCAHSFLRMDRAVKKQAPVQRTK